MRVLIITPTAFPCISGNAVTVERWRLALTKKGIFVEVLASDELDPMEFQKKLHRFRPDIIHAHHAFKTASLLMNCRKVLQQAKAAVVVSLGGTDFNEDLSNTERKESVLSVFQMAHSIVVQNPAIMPHFRQSYPVLAKKIVSVPKAVCWFGDQAYDLRKTDASKSEDILFLLPSGVRPVKRNLECLQLMKQVYQLRPKVRFVAVGPVINAEYADRFEQEIFKCSTFARWIMAIPPAAMRSIYLAADVVLNASSSEGLSNSLMEAIAVGRPVLASDIEGNRWPIMGEDGDAPAGLLYDLHCPEDFIEKALALIDDDSLRTSLSLAAHSRQKRWSNPEAEAEGLIAAYKAALC
jgi:L-malate glycosyltransferase